MNKVTKSISKKSETFDTKESSSKSINDFEESKVVSIKTEI